MNILAMILTSFGATQVIGLGLHFYLLIAAAFGLLSCFAVVTYSFAYNWYLDNVWKPKNIDVHFPNDDPWQAGIIKVPPGYFDASGQFQPAEVDEHGIEIL